jgi:hypothetical protein
LKNLYFLGCILFSCCGAPDTHFSWVCFCYNGQCWRCQSLCEISQPVSSGGAIYHCGKGNVIISLVMLTNPFDWIFILNLEVFWLYSEHIASAMLAAIKDDQFIHVNLSVTAWSMASLNSFSNASDQLNIATILFNNYTTSAFNFNPQLINGHYQAFNFNSTNQRTLSTSF